MKASVDNNDRQFLRCLHRIGAASVQQLCDEMGVTATAVRQRLARLHAGDLVARETVRAGRGRPHHAYRVTEQGLKALGDNYSDLALILWRELRNIEEPAIRQHVLSRVREALVAQFSRDVEGDSLDERMVALKENLEERGYDVEVDATGKLPILRENNCPYLELANDDTTICELEQAVFAGILGSEMQLTQCCLDGHTCCEFEPVAAHD